MPTAADHAVVLGAATSAPPSNTSPNNAQTYTAHRDRRLLSRLPDDAVGLRRTAALTADSPQSVIEAVAA